jgi:nicotinamide-nucleotide amidase
MNAEIITIGTELLLGEIVDTNQRWLARALRDQGIDLYRTVTVGDNQQRIAQAVSESLGRSRVVITTGGLGPTVDDVTREGIALALEADLEFRPDLWETIVERFASFGRHPTENNRSQACLPRNALVLENPLGTAPGFVCAVGESVVVSLPGVPVEMTAMMESQVIPLLRERFSLRGVIRSRLVRVAGIGESALDERISDLERLANPTVGLSAHPGRVDIRITSKASHIAEAEELIWGVEATIRQRLGDIIYGVDDETLEEATLQRVAERGMRLVVVESSTGGELAASLASRGKAFASGYVLPTGETDDGVRQALRRVMNESGAKAGLGLQLNRGEERAEFLIMLRLGIEAEELTLKYGGPPANAIAWGVSMALDLLRRRLPISGPQSVPTA